MSKLINIAVVGLGQVGNYLLNELNTKKNNDTNAVEITSQNHGFAVDLDSLPKKIIPTHVNLNDNTSEGLRCEDFPAFSVQYHPESSPGPHDSRYLFQQFIDMMEN